MRVCSIGMVILWGVLAGCAGAQPTGSEQPLLKTTCEISGCSGEICSEKGKKMISPCVVLPQYECLRKSRCEAQESGKCGWTKTPEYLECMKKFKFK